MRRFVARRVSVAFLLCWAAVSGKLAAMELGLQAWTYRHLTFAETVERAAAHGIRWIEAYPGHAVGGGIHGVMGPELGTAERARVRELLAQRGVKLSGFGVAGASDEKGWRALFAFAKEMSIPVVCIEPKPEHADFVAAMCDEHGVRAAIHNHPQPSRYWDPRVVIEVVKGKSAGLGACADTGHWVRSGLDPVDCLRLLEGRIFTAHLKDVARADRQAEDAVWGTGVGRVREQIAELKRQGFAGVVSIEHEKAGPKLDEEVAANARFFRAHAGD